MNDVIKSRRTIHEYLPKKVDENLILNTLQTSLWAPNHKLTNPTRFYMVGVEKRMELVDLALKIKSEKGFDVNVELVGKVKKKILNPSHLVIITQNLSPDPVTEKEDYANIACVVYNISLLLWPHGIGSKWSTGPIIKRPEIYKICGINPQIERIEGLIRMGYPDKIKAPIARPELNTILKRLP
ncbi:MAG: nitroreductase [Deltaproteobacteria bacterium]|nr:MAG: nitroreductase [Deltaproteobacteria bacterium]